VVQIKPRKEKGWTQQLQLPQPRPADAAVSLTGWVARRSAPLLQPAPMEHRLRHTLRVLGSSQQQRQQQQQQHVLVVGATGLLGRAVVEHFDALESWTVSSIARRELQGEHHSTHYQLDLTDGERCRAVLSSAPELRSVTQVVYTALYGSDVWDEDERRVNLAMLKNVLEPMLEVAGGLRHIDLMQGRESLAVLIRARPAGPPLSLGRGLLAAAAAAAAGKAYPSQDLLHWPAKEHHTVRDACHRNRVQMRFLCRHSDSWPLSLH
jgi:hypothetical protein